jgi:hypothetical protein
MADEHEIAADDDRGDEQGRLGDWGRLESRRVEAEPSLLGASPHVLALAKAP